MRFFRTRTFKIEISKRKALQKILKTNLGLSSNEIKQTINNINEKTMSYAIHRFTNNCLLLQKYNIEVRPVEHLPYCLQLLPCTLEHRINMLRDMGIWKLNITQMNKLTSHLNTSVYNFQKLTNIPLKQDIKKNIFSRFDKSQINMSHLILLNNSMKTKDYYNQCVLSCKNGIFGLPDLDNKVLLETDIKYKSISMIAETLKVLRLDLHYDNQYIIKNPKIILAPAANVRSLLKNFRDTGLVGLSIEEVLRKYSYLLFEDANNIKQLLYSFKCYDIPEEYVRKFMKIFTLGNDLFVERMGMIMRHPDLHLWYKYPRILQLIFYKSMVLDRAKYLRHMNCIKWARAHTILSQKNVMDRFVRYGANTFMSQKPLQYLLNIKLKIHSKNVKLIKKLMRHPHWKTAGFNDIEKMLDYLMENFTIDEICQNIHIVLYSQFVVEKMLTELRQKYSQSTEYSFTNSQYLALCLYMLEKDNHFTGDGIWSKGHSTMQQSPPNNRSTTNRIDSDANINVLSAKTSDEIDSNLYDKNEISTRTM